MTKERHSIMIIDDHPIIHDGLKILLSNEPDMEVSAAATSASEALDVLECGLPDLAIVDLSMGDSDGLYLIQRIHAVYPGLKMIVYTMSEERLFAKRAALAGARGYIMKTSPPPLLIKSLRDVLAGKLSFAPDILKRIEQSGGIGTAGSYSQLDTLSNREMDIFKLLGEGLDSIGISEKLNISRNTVDTHRINIKNKLNLPSGKALERLAYETIQQGKLP